MHERNSEPADSSSTARRVKLDEWEWTWLRAMLNFVSSCSDLERVRIASSPDTDSDSLIERLFIAVDRAKLSQLTSRVEDLAQALADSTYELFDAIELSRLDDKEDRELALGLHKARLEKIAEDFDLDKKQRQGFSSYAAAFFNSQRNEHNQTSLNSGLLSVLDGALEVLIRDLMSFHLKQRDIQLDLHELGLSYSEILECRGPTEFRDLAVSRKVDALTAKSMNKWIDWFSARDKLLIDPAQLIDRELVEDFHLMRNVLVHEGGVVSARHSRVAHNSEWFQVGKRIPPSSRLLRLAVISYLAFATSIWTMATRRLFSGENLRILHNLIQVELLRGNFFAVVVRCEALWELGDEEDANRINLWFAGSRLKNKKYSNEVEEWQPKSTQMQLVKMLLQQKKSERKEAIGLAQRLYNSGELSIVEVYGWPLLDAIRDEIDLSSEPLGD